MRAVYLTQYKALSPGILLFIAEGRVYKGKRAGEVFARLVAHLVEEEGFRLEDAGKEHARLVKEDKVLLVKLA